MKFRWKLLILLLAISIVPIVCLRTFGIQNVRLMADVLISQVKGKQLDDARHRLQLVVNEYSKVIRTSSCDIKSGQIIILGTDGIWEARNAEGELFGKKRLQQAIHTNSGESARTIVLSVLDAVEEFRGKGEQEDDLTLVITKITEV